MKRVEDFATYLLTNPREIQEIVTQLHSAVLKSDNSVFVALTEKTSAGEIFILASSGLDQDSLVGLSWLRISTQFPTITCLNSGAEVYLPDSNAWLSTYPESALFREKMGVEEILCFPINWGGDSRYCLSMAFGERVAGRTRDLEMLRGFGRLLQTYLSQAAKTRAESITPPNLSMKRKIESLAPRQQETVNLVLQGLNNQAIADQLGISINTVKSDLKKIFKDLGVSYRSQIYAELLDDDKNGN